MTGCRNLLAKTGWILGSLLAVEAQANQQIMADTMVLATVKMPGKHTVQTVVRPDGWVVDRLAGLETQKASADTRVSGGVPASPEAWLARMMDPTRNGLVIKHPEYLADWLDSISEPRFMTALASVALKPEVYAQSLEKLADPATFRNWAEIIDPQVYLRWMALGIDPKFYQSVFYRMTDSGKLRRWGIQPALQGKIPDGSVGASQDAAWLQLPQPPAKANPWLVNSVNYRY
jgi:hypothetical protein